MDCNENINPWTTFLSDDDTPKRICDSIIIDNRFPNHFKRSSSLVTCNFCRVILLKNKTQQHFKIHHNKKFKKKFSKFKIPFNAVEGYDLICEIRKKKLAISNNINRTNKSKDLFKLKHKHSENAFAKQSSKTPSKLLKKIQKDSKSQEYKSPKTNTVSDISVVKSNDIEEIKHENEHRMFRKCTVDRKSETQFDTRKIAKISKRSILPTTEINNKRLKSTDLKLNIRLNSDGLLTSSLKGDIQNCPNIFDRMSHFCDDTITEKKVIVQTPAPSRGFIKQSGFDESCGCAIFTDEFNNSILIDTDKDDVDDFDCCESSLSNDSAYFSLPNTTSNPSKPVTSMSSKPSSNHCDCSVAPPPLVTAYQYSNMANKVSYSVTDSKPKDQPKSMHVTRSLSYNSIAPPKSTVKHRFYVSGHSNQTILNTLRKKSNEFYDNSYGMENDNHDGNGVLHGLSKESQDLCYFDKCQSANTELKHPVNSKSYRNGIRDISDHRFWSCFEGNGLNVSTLIPKGLKWTQSRNSRRKNIAQVKVVSSKPSPKNIAPKPQLNSNTIHVPVSENPLLTSLTIGSNNSIDDSIQSDPILSSEIILDYQFPDRNQMSFQQRLLERGVISQRDIARSQRCLSFNSNARKSGKMSSMNPNVIEYNRMSNNKNFPIKSQVICQTGYNSGPSNSFNTNQIKSSTVHLSKIQSTPMMDAKVNCVTRHVPITHRKHTWREGVHLVGNQNVSSSFHGQGLSQNTKYINTDRRITVSPRQNMHNNGMSAITRSLESRSTNGVFIPTVSYSSIVHSNNSNYNQMAVAQNIFTSDSSRFSRQPIEGRYIHVDTTNSSRRFRKPDNESMNYHRSCDDITKQCAVSHSNYQTMYNPQIKFPQHSTTIYNANFEL